MYSVEMKLPKYADSSWVLLNQYEIMLWQDVSTQEQCQRVSFIHIVTFYANESPVIP